MHGGGRGLGAWEWGEGWVVVSSGSMGGVDTVQHNPKLTITLASVQYTHCTVQYVYSSRYNFA